MAEKGLFTNYSPNEIGVHDVVHFGNVSFNLDTIVTTWFAMVLVIIFAIMATRKLQLKPRGAQNFFESFLEFIAGLVDGSLGPKGRSVLPYVATLFLFIVSCNLMSAIPILEAPTSDINTTAGLALFVFIFVNGMMIFKHGLGNYFKHYFKPFVFFFPINIIETVAKPMTLALRLFGNILAGDVLLIVLNLILPTWFPVPTIVWMMFSLFVAGVQAFVFTLLTISYLSESFAEDVH
ncbi:MAG: F0F1 ATP synthase subunit A [Bacillota bacterium]